MKHKMIRPFLFSILILLLFCAGTAPCRVLAASPVIRSISISPGTTAATRDSTCAFTVSIVGENNYTREVAWSVSGQTSRNTFIDGNGILNISADELSTSLVVKAISKQDSRYSATALVSLPKPTCQINVNTSPDNAGAVTESRVVDYGGSVTLEASAREGYQFDSWMENGAILGTDTKLTLNNITQNREITAMFSKNRFDITLNCSPAYSGAVTGQGTYNRGSNVTLTATPIQGYRFVGWSENGTIVYVNAEYPIDNITRDRNLTAVFEMEGAVTYTINASVTSGSGTVTPEGSTRLTQGSGILYTVTPESGYTIGNVSIDGVPMGALSSYTFSNVKGDHTITVDFTALPVQNQPAPEPAEQTKPDRTEPESSKTTPESGKPIQKADAKNPETDEKQSEADAKNPEANGKQPEAEKKTSVSEKKPSSHDLPSADSDQNGDTSAEKPENPAEEKNDPDTTDGSLQADAQPKPPGISDTTMNTENTEDPEAMISRLDNHNRMTAAIAILALLLASAATVVLILYIVRKRNSQ